MTPLLSSALLATQTDERLLALASAGHDRAFEAIVERYRRPLGRYLRRLLSGPLAEDVLQATFVNAWRSLSRGTEVRDLRAWLYRIAHNQAVNALARAEPQPAADADQLAATAPGPEAEAEHRDTLQRALTAISRLPDRQRAALVAVAVEDRPHTDVARDLGLTEGALRQLVHRARTSLRTAATALVPTPFVTAAASAGHDATVARVAEVAAGAGGAGLGIKTGAAILAAGALVIGAPAGHEPRPLSGRGPVATADAAASRPAPRVATAAPAPARTSATSPERARPARSEARPATTPRRERRGPQHGRGGTSGRGPTEAREHRGVHASPSSSPTEDRDGHDASTGTGSDSPSDPGRPPDSGDGSVREPGGDGQRSGSSSTSGSSDDGARAVTTTEAAGTSGSGPSGSSGSDSTSSDSGRPPDPVVATVDVAPAAEPLADSSGRGSGG